MFKPGDDLHNKTYVIQEQLTDEDYSGFGVTYKAVHRHSVVLKLPNRSQYRDPNYQKYLADFQQEAKTLRQLMGDRHPHIVQVENLFEVGVEDWDEPILCMVMEYIEGTDLWQRVYRKDDREQIRVYPLTEAEALIYIQQVGSALTHLHRYQPEPILHRDVKPNNIIIRGTKNEAVLIDFGLARKFVPNLTKQHTVAASPGFTPLEQYYEEAKRGAYTDVYGLAATLYFLLTGRVPESATDRSGALQFFKKDSLEPPQKLNPSISDRVNEGILWGMAFLPEDRPQSVEQWLKALNLIQTESNEVIVPAPNQTATTVDARRLFQPNPLVRWLGRQNAAPTTPTQLATPQPLTFQLQPKKGGKTVPLELLPIPGGTFWMGQTEAETKQLKKEAGEDTYNQFYACELPRHRVTVPPFWMGRFPVTQAQYEAVMGENPATGYDQKFVSPQQPVIGVSWDMAVKFCEALNRLVKEYQFRLPTEAEWEYACRLSLIPANRINSYGFRVVCRSSRTL
jgi:serine/threonine protein kinase